MCWNTLDRENRLRVPSIPLGVHFILIMSIAIFIFRLEDEYGDGHDEDEVNSEGNARDSQPILPIEGIPV
jgi:hypothetical protein